MIGQTISHYKITAKLGEVGIRVVSKAPKGSLQPAARTEALAMNLHKDRSRCCVRSARELERQDHAVADQVSAPSVQGGGPR